MHCGSVGKFRFNGVDDDKLCAPIERSLHVHSDDRVAVFWVRADHHDTITVNSDLRKAICGSSVSDCFSKSCYCRSVSNARTVIDIVRA